MNVRRNLMKEPNTVKSEAEACRIVATSQLPTKAPMYLSRASCVRGASLLCGSTAVGPRRKRILHTSMVSKMTSRQSPTDTKMRELGSDRSPSHVLKAKEHALACNRISNPPRTMQTPRAVPHFLMYVASSLGRRPLGCRIQPLTCLFNTSRQQGPER